MKKFVTLAGCALAFGVLMEARSATAGVPARAMIAGVTGLLVLFAVSVAKGGPQRVARSKVIERCALGSKDAAPLAPVAHERTRIRSD